MLGGARIGFLKCGRRKNLGVEATYIPPKKKLRCPLFNGVILTGKQHPPTPINFQGKIRSFSDSEELNVTLIAMENGPGWKMYFLLKIGIYSSQLC